MRRCPPGAADPGRITVAARCILAASVLLAYPADPTFAAEAAAAEAAVEKRALEAAAAAKKKAEEVEKGPARAAMHVNVCMYVHTNECIHMCMYTCVYIYSYLYIDHAYAHTHAHQVEKARLAAEEKENAESKKAEGTDKAAKKKMTQTSRGLSLPDIGNDNDSKLQLRAFIEELKGEVREKEQMVGALQRNFESLSGLCLKAETEKQQQEILNKKLTLEARKQAQECLDLMQKVKRL